MAVRSSRGDWRETTGARSIVWLHIFSRWSRRMSQSYFARREFLQGSAAAAAATLFSVSLRAASPTQPKAKVLLEPLDYDDVRLLPSHWQKQYQACRDTYLGLPEDDI